MNHSECLPVMAVHLAYSLEGLGVVVAVSGVHSVQSETECWTHSRSGGSVLPGGEVGHWEILVLGAQHYQGDGEAEQPDIELASDDVSWICYQIFSPDDQHRPEDDRSGADTAAPLTVPAASREWACEEFLHICNQFVYDHE